MTKSNKLILFLILTLLLVFAAYQTATISYNNQTKIIYSLDKKQNDQEIISIIDNADKYVYFAVYAFTRDNIADALVKAKKRGLIVWGITDKNESETEYEKPVIEKLLSAGVTVETQRHKRGIMHIKAVVTDKGYAMGSYNWTNSATVANDELLETGTNRYFHDQYFEILKRVLMANQ